MKALSAEKIKKIRKKYTGCSEEEAIRRWRADKKTRKKQRKALNLGTQPKASGGKSKHQAAPTANQSQRHSIMAIITGEGE